MTVKFEMLDRFIEQRKKANQAFDEFVRREKEAYQEYQSLKAQYEQLIQKSVLEGKDATKELDKLSEQIEAAKKAYERRQQERAIFSTNNPFLKEITSEDVVRAWNEEFIPEFRKQVFDDVLKNLLRAKYEYAKAFLAYHDAVAEFERMRQEARSALGDGYYYKFNGIELNTVDQIERYFITIKDLYDFNNKKLPQSIKYVREEDLK
ncbi:hypothetical protein PTHTG4_09880 [Parageobacillus thermoglucosidasius]|uniref:hypothetical protein n=1 Tax=Parageobacillus thermoglucosidasius TaxID=1426 RepID=UPI000F61BFE0|nr:hypothetical protein [Parageobacillus thermoglucosidasius]GCD81926.1 hypothetical protein PTHTG4_09880 [Parageobacillus thermoglucosidasius]